MAAKRKTTEKVIPFEDAQPQPQPEKDDKPEIQPQQPPILDDDQVAIQISDKWRSIAMFLRFDWYIWRDGYWQKRDMNQVYQAVRRELRSYRVNGVQVSARKIAGITRLLEMDLFRSDETFLKAEERQADYLCLANGLLNLKTFELEPHKPDMLFTNQLDFDYNPKAECPTFHHYLNTSLVFPDGRPDYALQGLFLQGLAYCLTARTDLKASFWFVGVPNSGKSTAIALVRNLMGQYHITIDLNQLATNRFLLSSIVGKRVVSFTEASGSSVLPDALYKAMVGGQDEIYADVKNKPAISFRPTAKFIWAMNEPPRFTDRSGATTNRLKVITFTRSVPKEHLDPNLEAKLVAERSGILNLLLEEYKVLCAAGFVRSAQSEEWLQAYIRENDTEATFLDENAKREPEQAVASTALYRAYRNWCDSFGFKAKNLNQVSKEWERLGLTRKRLSKGVVWQGIQLIEQ